MEHLKTIMEKLDDMKLSEKAMDDGDYLLLMGELKKAYDMHNVGKFVRVLRINTSINVFWSDVVGNTNLCTERMGWAHTSGRNEDDDEEDHAFHLDRVEVEMRKRNTHYTLKIIQNDEGEGDASDVIDWINNTIKTRFYDKIKTCKYINNPVDTIIYINDVE
tara:strand:+ start:207 stop:692 length:486 start_codon:yes stop_codon:yes gene_type:complete